MIRYSTSRKRKHKADGKTLQRYRPYSFANPFPSFSAFQQVVRHDDVGDDQQPLPIIKRSASDGAVFRRLENARRKLGSYRHDLLVALRVVNRIERETTELEWTKWLMGETVRCKKLSVVIQGAKTQNNTQTFRSPRDWTSEALQRAQHLREGYCRSCMYAQGRKSRERLS